MTPTALLAKKQTGKTVKLNNEIPKPKKRKTFKVASLFSGCGGLDLGFTGNFKFRSKYFDENPFEIVFSNDIDQDAVKTYNNNSNMFNKHEAILGDIKEIPSDNIPDFDVLLAGFPCQPFSNAGNREGVDDKYGRGTLFYECERIMKAMLTRTTAEKPLAFVFENVKGILSSKMKNGNSVPAEIVKRMQKLGYNTVYKLLRASDYGVPQNRQRVIFVGVRSDLWFFDFDIIDSIVKQYNLPNHTSNPYELYLGSILSNIPSTAKNVKDIWRYSPSGQKMIEEIGPCLDGKEKLSYFKKKVPLEDISDSIKNGKSWKNMSYDKMTPRFRKIHDNPKKYHAPNFYRRFALGEICGTITASGQPENSGITHPFENRRYSVREIARIQSFPDDFIFPSNPISAPYKVIGNAVPPVLGWVIAKALSTYLNEKLTK